MFYIHQGNYTDMSLLHLVRHGQASAGTDNYDRLSPVGQEQSRVLGNWWQSHGFSPNEVYHGTLVRQRDTAALALQALTDNDQIAPMVAHPGLNEYDHRIIESSFSSDKEKYTPEAMSFADYMAIMSRWRDHQTNHHTNDTTAVIETWASFKARGWNTLQELSHGGTDNAEFVFFSSGGVIATILATVLDLDFEHTIDAIWRIRNTSVTTFHVSGGKARLVDFNTVAHLQEQRKPHLVTLI